ncbi:MULTISPECIES: hypothetical protein [unclassified Agrococcus]|uniref:hypothetical protein n=1 Tax=unclassified Agrococcus TaxID=2615065 RepID=UPI00361331FF
MVDERVPGPSPAYDPFQGTPSVPQQRHEPAATSPPTHPQPAPPVRNADGSWTVEVHAPEDAAPSPAYPAPRQPIAAVSVPRRSVQPQPAAAAPRPPRGGRRVGLVLGIAIPAAVLALGGVAAAIVVPGVLLDRDAQAAADAYAQEQAAWESTFSDAALQPFAELDTAAFDAALLDVAATVGSGSYAESAADAGALQTACDAMSGLDVQAAMLTTAPPALRVVEGGARNAAYAAASADAAASQAAFAASTTFATDVAGSFDAIGGGCALVLAQAQAHADFAGAHQALLATLTLPTNGTERLDLDAGRWIEFTCLSPEGCASFVDRAARATTGDAWDAAYVVYEQAMAQTYRDHCPTADLRTACDAWASMHDRSAELASAVGQAYREEDVAGGAASGADASPAPDLVAAVDAYVAGTDAGVATARQATAEATGSQTMLQAVDGIVGTEAQSIRDAAAAIRG